MHIAYDCPKALLKVQLFYLKQLTEDDENQKSTKKRKLDIKNKDNILKYVENQELPLKRQEQLENGMCLAFVCTGILFNVTKNEIFCVYGFKISDRVLKYLVLKHLQGEFLISKLFR